MFERDGEVESEVSGKGELGDIYKGKRWIGRREEGKVPSRQVVGE